MNIFLTAILIFIGFIVVVYLLTIVMIILKILFGIFILLSVGGVVFSLVACLFGCDFTWTTYSIGAGLIAIYYILSGQWRPYLLHVTNRATEITNSYDNDDTYDSRKASDNYNGGCQCYRDGYCTHSSLGPGGELCPCRADNLSIICRIK